MADRTPLVVACLAPADLRPSVDPLTGAVAFDERRAELSVSDAAALEYALRAAGAWGGRVVALGAGPAWIEPALHEAVALGASAVRVPLADGDLADADLAGGNLAGGAGGDLAGDPQRTAACLAAAITDLGGAALVVCGDRSPTYGVGAVPALLAHALGAAQALGLVSLTIEGDAVVCERRLDGGWRERLRLVPPAVCSVEAAGVQLRRASLRAVLDATSTEVAVTAAAPRTAGGPAGAVRIGTPRPYRPRTHAVPPPVGGTRQRLLALTGALADRDPPRVVGPLPAAAAADELLDYLGRHGYGPAGPAPA
jgi:electron transfer flavoprotein beta subunit